MAIQLADILLERYDEHSKDVQYVDKGTLPVKISRVSELREKFIALLTPNQDTPSR